MISTRPLGDLEKITQLDQEIGERTGTKKLLYEILRQPSHVGLEAVT